jgi:di/tricarboxylate transporter
VEAGDVLIVYAERESLNRLIEDTGLHKIKPVAQPKFQLEGSNMAELILTPRSRLYNHSLTDIHFRDKYGLTVLALKHQYREPIRPAADEQISYGDALLVHGKWKDIDILSKEKNDIIVLGHAVQPATHEQNFHAVVASFILIWMLLMLVFEWLPPVVTVVITALLMLLTGCVRNTDQAYRSVNWQTVVLIAAMLPMATALEKTGGVAFMSERLISSLGAIGPLAVLAGLYVITSAFSQFISNTATAVLLYPVAILTAQQMGVSPVPMVMAVAFSASMAFATPVATPPNAMVMAAGKYTFFDFVRVGVPLQVIIAFIAVLFIPLFFPF